MRNHWATVCPAIRIGTSGKVRGMRAECPGVSFQATNPPQPPPVLYDSTKVQVHCKLTSDPSTRVKVEIKRSATTPSRPRYEYNPRSLTSPFTATGNPSREFEQTLTRLGHHKARTLPLPYPTAARRRGALSFVPPHLSLYGVSRSRPFRLLPTCSQTASPTMTALSFAP